MLLIYLVVIALIQGITEFLPVSSSAHLILLPSLLDLEDQGLLIDVMAHSGTLCAVILYFKKDVHALLCGLIDLFKRRKTDSANLFINICIATPPTLIAGFLMNSFGIDLLIRNPLTIAITTIVFGVLLWHADRSLESMDRIELIDRKSAFLIGIAQTLALIPGVSRSGITMTIARYLKFDRKSSARFSMLISIPLISLLTLYAFLKLFNQSPDRITQFNWQAGLIVAFLSFVSAYFVIRFFMSLISKTGFGIFVLYRLILGCLLFLYILF